MLLAVDPAIAKALSRTSHFEKPYSFVYMSLNVKKKNDHLHGDGGKVVCDDSSHGTGQP